MTNWKKFDKQPQGVSTGHDFFHPVDLFFSKKFLKNAEESSSLFLSYLLKTAREGHLCVKIENEALFPSLDPQIDAILIEGAKNLPPSLFEEAFVKEENRFYLKRNWECEKRFFFHWQRLKNQGPELEISSTWLVERLEKESLLLEQKKAILEIASKSLSFLLGGPGTGKTYTAKILIKVLLEKVPGRFACAAPTGKATGNLREALKDLSERCSVQTLHSLLKRRLLSEDFILVDEASMIDAELMSRLFASVKDGARLVLLGDPDQLPPVESGNFFAELVEKNEVSLLKTCLRAEIVEILNLAQKVKSGAEIPFEPLPKLQELIKLIGEKEDYRILTPLRKGLYGVENLNTILHEINLRKGKKKIPIMVKVNDPFRELYNGDVGILDTETKMGQFGTRMVPEYSIPPYELAYAHSIHRSQGSEYEKVLILIPEGAEVFGREMLYTAITRAKKKAEIYAIKPILEKILSNKTRRFSGLFT